MHAVVCCADDDARGLCRPPPKLQHGKQQGIGRGGLKPKEMFGEENLGSIVIFVVRRKNIQENPGNNLSDWVTTRTILSYMKTFY